MSTTFDPCMYLSLPIPGGTDRIVKVTYVPLPTQTASSSSSSGSVGAGVGAFEFSVKLNKNATIGALRSRIVEMANEMTSTSTTTTSGGSSLEEVDVVLADVFQHKVRK